MEAIQACRTAKLGGHMELCVSCGHHRPAYNSCRNRHCPKCQSLAQAHWLEGRKARILPTPYFHVVFTLPQELRPIALSNRRRLYGLLMEKSAQTLLALGQDKRHLGAEMGVTAVLHTWTRQLSYHPHCHCVVTSGGLSADGGEWKSTPPDYLFPVEVLSALFRGKFMSALTQLYDQSALCFEGSASSLKDAEVFSQLKSELYKKKWVVYSKRPFGGAEQVYSYLGRYTHRVAISNPRLISVTPASVCFSTKNGQTAELHPHEFIRRFLLHVLPKGFVKIRHSGLMSPAHAKTRLELARQCLEKDVAKKSADGSPPVANDGSSPTLEVSSSTTVDFRDHLFSLTGIDLKRCPKCHQTSVVRVSLSTDLRGFLFPPAYEDSS